MSQCTARCADGSKCHAPPVKGKKRCIFHSSFASGSYGGSRQSGHASRAKAKRKAGRR